ncbi:MAG: DUF359 domain-containing protein [Nitrososphaerota archaeon]
MYDVVWPPKSKIVFTEEMKEKVRKPIGELIKDRYPDIVTIKLKNIIEESRPSLVVAVGDFTSSQLYKHSVNVDIYIVDEKIERRKTTLNIPMDNFNVIECVNEAGTISPDAVEKIDKVLREHKKNTIIKVDGEEDLLTLAVILSAPENSIVIYGQPGEGAVIVKVSRELKEKMLEILRDC